MPKKSCVYVLALQIAEVFVVIVRFAFPFCFGMALSVFLWN